MSSTRPRRTQQERSNETRRRVIEAAISCICELGIADSSTHAIAARAGVSRGALQHQFHTRSDLIIAVVEDVAERMIGEFTHLDVGHTSIEQRLDAITDAHWPIYFSPAYQAVIEILFGGRNDPEIESARRRMAEIERAGDGRWQQAFGGAGLSPDEITALRYVVTAAMRGLAIRGAYRPDDRAGHLEREVVKRMCRALLIAPAIEGRAAE